MKSNRCGGAHNRGNRQHQHKHEQHSVAHRLRCDALPDLIRTDKDIGHRNKKGKAHVRRDQQKNENQAGKEDIL